MPSPIPTPTDPADEERKRRAAEKRAALKALEAMAAAPVALQRPVVFVPGWAGEDGVCWMRPYDGLLKNHGPIKAWIERCVRVPDRDDWVHFVTFTQDESKACRSFLDFAPLLKARVRAAVGTSHPLDLVCHSMGSLDAIAAITQAPDPLAGVVNLVAVGSPLQGIFYGKLVPSIDELLPNHDWTSYQYEQVKRMNSSSVEMQLLNLLDTRRRLLDRIAHLYEIEGTQDMVVMRSAKLKREGLTTEEKRQITHRTVGGAMHVDGAGITQDPRTAAMILQILATGTL